MRLAPFPNESFLAPKADPVVQIPKTLLDTITKDRGISDKTSNAFKESAKGWEDYFNQCGVPVKTLSQDPDFARKLIEGYGKDIYNPKVLSDLSGIKDGIGEGLINQISGTYQSAEIKGDSPFYWFQKAAKWHLKYIMDQMEKIPALQLVAKEIKTNGWSYHFGVGNSLDDAVYA